MKRTTGIMSRDRTRRRKYVGAIVFLVRLKQSGNLLFSIIPHILPPLRMEALRKFKRALSLCLKNIMSMFVFPVMITTCSTRARKIQRLNISDAAAVLKRGLRENHRLQSSAKPLSDSEWFQ